MSSVADKVCKVYKNLSHTPILTAARLSQNCLAVNSFWTQRNIEIGKNTKYMRTHYIDKKLNKVAGTLPSDITTELLSAVSSSEKYRAVLRDYSNGKENRKQYLEVWNNNNLTHAVDLTALNVHGDVYTDVVFKSFDWSPDETKIVYVAEKKLPTYEPFYKRKSEKSQNNSDGDSAPVIKGEEYLYRQDWGEQLVGKYRSVIAIYDIIKDSVDVIDGVPESVCPGQVCWSPDGTYLVGVAYFTEPRKLGLIYCTNRRSNIFTIDLKGNYAQMTVGKRAVDSPRFTPDGRFLVWVEREARGAHNAALALMRLEISLVMPVIRNHLFNNPVSGDPAKSKQVQQCLRALLSVKPCVVVDIVETEKATTKGQPFYGLFNVVFPTRCWAADNRRLIFSVSQKVSLKTYVVDIESFDLTELEFDDGSQIIMDVCDDVLLLSRRNYLYPDKLVAAKLPSSGKESEIQWKELTESGNIEALEGYNYHYMDLEQDTNDDVKRFTAIYLGPETGSEKQVPLIVWPHGGPHGSFVNAFSIEAALFASLGYAILFVNYRGSVGHGNASVNFLLGRVGNTDVKDCVLAAQECCKMFPLINPAKIALVGGSHGGFLVHHLSGQYPDMFKAVVSRNPVVDIASMSIISDIPDWCAVEAAGIEYTQQGPVDNELFMAMRKASPIQYVDKVKAPTYLMIGSKDLRVPAAQGMEFYHRLKANGVTVKMNIYDDNHPLAAVPNEMDNLINSALWLLEHTS